MKQVTKYLVVLLSVFFIPQMKATHIVGGEIFYDNLGGNNYRITLKVYRDCFNGQAQLPNPALIRFYDINGILRDSLKISMLSLNNIAPTINNPCVTPPGSECVEEGLYIDSINLPPRTGGYYVVFQSCCRNNSILNLVTPGATGVTYWEHIPGPEVVAANSSPRFNNFPPIYLCNGVQIKFDHSATDPDGDVLVYSLCDPYDGCSPSPPGGICPIDPPPYNPVQFVSPYSGSYPMSSNPATAINSANGYLTGTPDTDGQWVVGICVQEWRGSTLIATHYRDFQFNVVTCNVQVLAQYNDQATPITINNVPVTNQFCSGYTLFFNNNSIGGTTFNWNFGDPNTLADTSHLTNASYTYPDTGAYVVSLIANPGKPCADTIKKTFYVYPELKPTLNAPPPQCVTNNSFTFTPGGLFAPTYTSFSWNFGGFANPTTSTVKNPVVVYSAPGIFPVQVLVQQKMCKKTLYDSVEVYPVPDADFNADSLTLCDPGVVTFINNSTAGGVPSYLWQFSDGGSSTAVNPTHVFSPAGVYNVTLTIKATAGCVDTSVFVVPGMVTVNPKPTAGFSLTPSETTIFDPTISFFDLSSGATSMTYNFGDGGSSTELNPIHAYELPNDYPVMQIVENQFGCKDTAVEVVHIKPEFVFWIPNSFTPGNKDGMNDIFKPSVFGVENYLFEIYDRWGECIFKTKDTPTGWDGTRGGKVCQQDVYVWMITFKNVVTLREEVHYGHVTLLK